MRKYLLVGLMALSVLVADVVVVATHAARDEDEPKHWDARVLPIVDFVQEHRELRFKHPVPVEFLDDAAFDKQVAPDRKETAEDKKALQQALGELRALGLVTGDVDLGKASDDLAKSSVIGLYVPSKKEVFVRGKELTPDVRVTLAHELTHVLQDQYFDLTKIRKDAFGGDDTSVTALIEGDAVRIQNQYTEALSSADLSAYHRELLREQREASSATTDIPAVLSDFLSFPYAFGPVLLAALEQTGGNAQVDKAFRHPPQEEAQVFDPVHHPYTENAVKLPAPSLPSGAKASGKPGPFGQVSLFEVLSTKLSYAQALAAIEGWTADTSQVYTQGGRTCVAVDVQDPALLSGAQDWATTTHATVTQYGDTVSIRSCDPGPGTRLPTAQHPTPFEVLEGRAALISTFITKGTPVDKSVCIADGLLSRLGPARYGILLAGTLTAAQQDTVRTLATAATRACL